MSTKPSLEIRLEKNELPADWQWKEVKDIAESIQYGYTESSSKQIIGPKFLRITDIQNNKVQWNDVPYCSIAESNKKKYLLKDGDLIFARTGATVGKSFLIKGKIPESVFASYLIRVRFKESILDKYVYNYFQSLHYWKQITEGQVGIGQPNVNGTKLGRLVVPIAPTDVQQEIVSKIEELFSELDKSIEQLKTAQQQLKVYRQSVLKWAFEGKLTNGNVKDDELPKGWSKTRLEQVSELITKGASPKWQGINYVDDQTQVLFITSENVRDNSLDVSEPKYLEVAFNDKQKRSILKKGDVLLNIVGASIGRAAIFNLDSIANINQAVSIIRLNESVSAKYLSFYLNSNSAKSYYNLNKVDVARANLSLKDVAEIELPLTTIGEQKSVVEEIENRFSVADKLNETITNSLQQAEALRQSILKKAFEGKFTI